MEREDAETRGPAVGDGPGPAAGAGAPAPEGRAGGAIGSLKRAAAAIALAVAVVVAAVILIGLDSHLTFIADDWALLVQRHGWSPDVFLEPFNQNIIAGQALIYKLLLAAFGMGSALPYFVLSISLFLLSAVLLFIYMRSRVGDLLALLGAISILFLGAAFEDLLFAFQMGYFAAVAAGLGMLIALDRDDAAGDRIACCLGLASVAISSLGLAFLAGALADLLLSRRPRTGRAYVALVPLALFLAWWLGWGQTASSPITLDNVVHLPGFVYDSASSGITSLLGLATGDGSEPDQPHLIWGRILLPIAIALTAFRVLRDRGVSRGLVIALAIGLAFWVLAGLNQTQVRLPTSSRYQYPSAVFLLLIATEAARGLRPPAAAKLAAVAVTGLALIGGQSLLHRQYHDRWIPASDSVRYSFAAVEIAGSGARPGYRVTISDDVGFPARTYLEAVRAHGSPALTESGLAARPEAERASADRILAEALGLALGPKARLRSPVSCRTLRASSATRTVARLGPGRLTLDALGRAPVRVLLGRFSDGHPVDLGAIGARGTASLRIPADESGRPWRLALAGRGPVSACSSDSY